MGYLILGVLLAGSIAALVLVLRSRQKAIDRAKQAEAAAAKQAKEARRLQDAYREETRRLVEMVGTDDERFAASLRILSNLAGDSND